MGLFHCIESSCARVEYQEYLPPIIRWRYPGEEWQEIEADNYSIETVETELELDAYYYWEAQVIWQYRYGEGQLIRNYTVQDLQFGSYNHHGIPLGRPLFSEVSAGRSQLNIPYESTNLNSTSYNLYVSSSYVPISWTFYNICKVPNSNVRDCSQGEPPPTNCKFTVYKDGQIVYQNTASECPEVEQLPCHLSRITEVINIKKLPYLERVEVRDESINIISIGFPLSLPFLEINELPSECLNIYLTATPASPFPQDNIPIPTFVNPYLFIAQICSADGCPPPAYQVICECCEHCPDNTCPVECNGHICCYDQQGIAVKQIDSTAYCDN